MAKTKFRPLHDRVVVKRIDAEEKTKGGIIIPDTAKEKPSQGEVIAVGPGGRDEAGKIIPPDVKSGDRVLFGKWSGTEVVLDGEELLIMKESDIMGVHRLRSISVAVRRRPDFERGSSAQSLDQPNTRSDLKWLRKTYDLAATRATRCCAASTFSPTP